MPSVCSKMTRGGESVPMSHRVIRRFSTIRSAMRSPCVFRGISLSAMSRSIIQRNFILRRLVDEEQPQLAGVVAVLQLQPRSVEGWQCLADDELPVLALQRVEDLDAELRAQVDRHRLRLARHPDEDFVGEPEPPGKAPVEKEPLPVSRLG